MTPTPRVLSPLLRLTKQSTNPRDRRSTKQSQQIRFTRGDVQISKSSTSSLRRQAEAPSPQRFRTLPPQRRGPGLAAATAAGARSSYTSAAAAAAAGSGVAAVAAGSGRSSCGFRRRRRLLLHCRLLRHVRLRLPHRSHSRAGSGLWAGAWRIWGFGARAREI